MRLWKSFKHQVEPKAKIKGASILWDFVIQTDRKKDHLTRYIG